MRLWSSIFSGGGYGPTTPRSSGGDPTNAGWYGIGGLGNPVAESGVTITPQTALGLPAVQRSVSLIAESIAQLPCRLYQRDGDARKQITDHPTAYLFTESPTGWSTPFELTEYKQLSLGLRGNAICLKDVAPDGSITRLYPLHPDRVQVLVSRLDRMPYYRVLAAPDGIEGTFPLSQIHHIRWISDNAYVGLSPIAVHRESLGIVAAADRHTSKVFANGARPSGVITRPREAPSIKEQSTIDRIKGQWEATYSGADNAGRVAFLQEGMGFTPLTMSNEDAQLIESRGYGVEEVARIYGIPTRMLGAKAQGGKSSFEQEALEFVIYCLLPWIRRHEEAQERDLLTATDRRAGLYVQYDFSALLRGDTAARYAAYAQARQWGWLSVNDIRRLENLPPIPGGDTYLVPLNMADGKTGLPITPNARPQPTDQQIRQIEEALQ